MHFEEMSTQNKLFYNTNVQSVSLYQRLRSLLQTYITQKLDLKMTGRFGIHLNF